jgi:hypothetical protein
VRVVHAQRIRFVSMESVLPQSSAHVSTMDAHTKRERSSRRDAMTVHAEVHLGNVQNASAQQHARLMETLITLLLMEGALSSREHAHMYWLRIIVDLEQEASPSLLRMCHVALTRSPAPSLSSLPSTIQLSTC